MRYRTVDCCPMAATQKMSCAPLSPLAASSAGSFNNSPVNSGILPTDSPEEPISSTYADLTSGGPDATETYSNPNNRNADRGPCYADRRHIFNLTGVVQGPRFSNHIVGALANNWSLSGIYKTQSGPPLDVFMFADRALTGITIQRPNQVLPDVYGSDGPGGQYFNPLAFARPALGATGNVGYSSLVGPRFWSFDV